MNGTHTIVYALRQFGRSQGFTLTAVLILGIGIGINVVLFSVVNAVFLRPPPVDSPDQLVAVLNTSAVGVFEQTPVSYPDYLAYRERNTVFDDVIAYMWAPAVIGSGDEQVGLGEAVSANYFETLGVRPRLGTFFSDDGGAESAESLVLSYEAFQRRFAGAPGMIGRTLEITGRPFVIVGVAPESFHGLFRGLAPEFWVTIDGFSQTSDRERERLDDVGDRSFSVVGRLREGINLAQVRTNVTTIHEDLVRERPVTDETSDIIAQPLSAVDVHPAIDDTIGNMAVVLLLFGGVILIISCANLSSQLLVRIMSRQREFAICMCIGASRWRIVMQSLTEGVTLALMGGITGLVLASWFNPILSSVELPLPFRVALDLSLDLNVFVFAVGLCVVAGVGISLGPANQSVRVNLFSQLKEDLPIVSAFRRFRLRNSLMVVQVALSLAMLILTGISVKSFWNATQIDPGFDPEGLTVASVPVGLRGYSPERTAQLYGALLSRIRSSAGVDGAALTSAVPLSLAVRLVRARVGERLLFVDTAGVTSGYFETMAIPVLQGEGFSTSDDLSAPTSVVINETMAERFWPGESPIGRSLEIGLDELRPVQIIGVAGDGRYRTLGEVPRPFIYVPLVASSTGTDTLVVRSANGVRASTQLIRDAITQADPTLPVFAVQSMDERIGAAFLLPRYAAVLFAVLGIFATGLVLIGLYSVVDYTARQGLREFGIRVAVGASPKQIFGLVISGAVRVVLLGSSLGLVVSYLFGRLVSGILYGVEPLDLSTYLLAVFCMFLVTLLAACRPALRVVLSDPSTALRVQ